MAAIAVLGDHVRGLLFEGLHSVAHPSLTAYFFFAGTSVGHEAVVVFFVLSGFFVGRSAIKARPLWSWRVYLANRLVRLYLVMLPALFLTAVLDQVSLRMPGGDLYFSHPVPHLNNAVPFVSAISPAIALGNAFFLQTILVPTFGSNTALWSLSNEFWYYVLFPLILIPAYAGRLFVRVLHLCLAALVGYLLPGEMLFYFLIWLIGAAINFAPGFRAGSAVQRLGAGVALVLFAGSIALAHSGGIATRPADFFAGLAFGLWIYFLLVSNDRNHRKTSGYGRAAAIVAGCSYSIYAIHLPLILLLKTTLNEPLWLPTTARLSFSLLICMFIAALGYGFARLTEARTESVRSRVLSLIGAGE